MNWNQEVKRRRKPSYVYRYTYVQNRHNIFLKIRAAKLKKWCVYVCGKRGGGGVELHIGLEIQYIYNI